MNLFMQGMTTIAITIIIYTNIIIIRFRQVSGDTNYPVADSGNDINRQRVALK